MPKHHRRDEVPVMYRAGCAASRGVFINPALTEPFGLTLIEAAASGLPIVATADGGPKDIVGNCHNGYLVDPLDAGDITRRPAQRADGRPTSLAAACRRTASTACASITFLAGARRTLPGGAAAAAGRARRRPSRQEWPAGRCPITTAPSSPTSTRTCSAIRIRCGEFVGVVRANRKCATFGIATGRSLESALKRHAPHGIPMPDVLISSLGTEIHYGAGVTPRTAAWARHIDHDCGRRGGSQRARRAARPERASPRPNQSRFKLSYFIDPP
jgi:sucrose-phosphate synthase